MNNSALSHWATWSEIHAQPEIWRGWGAAFDLAGARRWLAAQQVDEIWLCGAGSSAYIGDMLAAGLEGRAALPLRAVASTDLVSRPHAYLASRKCCPLVISFGRSGNSAESIGVLDALDALMPEAPRLNITCNSDSVLATRAGGGEQWLITLPEACHDAGFAMTSSLTTMYLTALALLERDCDFPARMLALADQLEALLPVFAAQAGAAPERVVYLGAGALTGAAREAALKVLELSGGQIPAIWDSTLGFRHGPKSFVRGDTAIRVFLSPDMPAARYDRDLVEELRAQFPGTRIGAVGPGGDIDFATAPGAIWSLPLMVALAQVESVIWADQLGLNVDDPFAGLGTLSRVVSGVRLYPVAP